MRVIAGSAKRIQLKTVEGMDTRPTTDRIKETLFNMLQYDLYDAVFLDLFSGSGAIGIEALSRGVKKSIMVEQNPKAVQCIRENLRATKLEAGAQVMQCDVMSALHRLEQGEVVDYIFMDPPYNQLLEKQVLTYLAKSEVIHGDTILIVEASKETTFAYVDELGYEVIKEKVYKTNQHIFLKKMDCKIKIK
ncbi:MAG: 16S rRNA (guanine(966)-N(2))-methyltransferase RsmD [Eubacteriales bacterium]